MSDFNIAIKKLLHLEGGYVNNPNDRGGATKYGISKRAYPEVDIANLTEEQASEIYRRDYWLNYGDINSQKVAEKVFDIAVNCGVKKANLLLQKAVNRCGIEIAIDGIVGPNTLKALNALPENWLLAELQLQQIQYYVELVTKESSQRVFLLGWIKRALSE